MRLLLDTHAFLWWVTDDRRLTAAARGLIGDGANEVFFSVASAWEIVVKSSLGRISLEGNWDAVIAEQVEANAFQVLPIHLRHALTVSGLPDLHRDPFDRMLVAQAVSEELIMLSSDRQLAEYPVQIRW
jgi:PIN domain nuclease of toxin-antitoxin system